MTYTRRDFVRNLGGTLITAPLMSLPLSALACNSVNEALEVHLFSKHVQFLDYKNAGQMAAELGFAGLDLTVRPKGHVLPENVKTDLAIALKDIEAGGSSCRMITTAIADVKNRVDLDVIEAAGKAGIEFYRCNWFKYKEALSLEESLEHYKEKVSELAEVNKEHNIIGCYQNHSGTKVGASVWEVKEILERANPTFFGAQYDIRHAVSEGCRSWTNGVKLMKDHIKNIVLKDFKWGKVQGKWKIVNVPIGEGMVDFNRYFKLLKSYGLKPPVSLHLEYPLGGAEKGRYSIDVDEKVVFDAMKKDLVLIQKLWKEA